MRKAFVFIAACYCFSTADAQSTVHTNGEKYVVIEEGTGAWCPQCPDGAVELDRILKNIPRTIGVGIHWLDSMQIDDGATVASTYFAGYPNGTVDRFAVQGNVALNTRNLWFPAASARGKQSAKADVSLQYSYDPATRTITANVEVKTLAALTGSYNTNVYITEDNCSGSGAGWDQQNAYDTKPGHPYGGKGDPIIGYKHMNVLRAMLGGPWGTAGVISTNAAANTSYKKSYTYVLPQQYKLQDIKIVALVQKESSNKSDREILNAIEGKLSATTSMAGAELTNPDIIIYPNPSSDQVTIQGTLPVAKLVALAITNSSGQVVFHQQKFYPAGQMSELLSLGHLSTGTYFITITGDNFYKTSTISISK